MPDLRQQLERCFRGRVCFMGIGSLDYGDDAFGLRLADLLQAAGVPDVIIAGTSPDRHVGTLQGFDSLIFLDALEFGNTPGSVVLLDSGEMSAVFPQISTHKISLGLLAGWVEDAGKTKAWLLGVQPGSLKAGQPLTPAVQTTLQALADLLLTMTGATEHPHAGMLAGVTA